jgi:hypothetical protein
VKKVKLLFDISGMIDGIVDGRGNGIFFCGYNLLKELFGRGNLNVMLYCSKEKAYLVEKAKSLNETLAKIPLAEYSDIDDAVIYWEELKYKNKIKNGSKIKRIKIQIILAFLKLLSKISCNILFSSQYQEIFKDVDIFFSPLGVIPDEIRIVKHIQKFDIKQIKY